MKISVEVKVSRQSKATKGWVLVVLGKPTLCGYKSKRDAIDAATALLRSVKLEIRPWVKIVHEKS